jgi:hypothetical protein
VRDLKALAFLPYLLLVGCNADPKTPEGYGEFERLVSQHPIGSDADHWIEMKNLAGEWERTGLIFGYSGDFEECEKAIAGLKKVNFAREYRCVPANSK